MAGGGSNRFAAFSTPTCSPFFEQTGHPSLPRRKGQQRKECWGVSPVATAVR